MYPYHILTMHKVVLLFLILSSITQTGSTLESTHYHVRATHTSAYLYHKFTNISDEVVPNNLSIRLSLSSVSGTLLYSMDSNMNQVIVTLVDVVPYMVYLEVNKQILNVSLSSLCGCEWCRYEFMVLGIQIGEFLSLQCNDRDRYRIPRTSTKNLNYVYPIMYTKMRPSTSPMNEAHMWLVNTPRHRGQSPNPAQMSGCIFGVWHHSDPIIFTNHTSNIGEQCSRKCTNDICNGGQCYETYETFPICNCTATFLNGRYCNDSISGKNLKITNQDLRFGMLKLSWKSSVRQIFEISDSYIVIFLVRDNLDLVFGFSYGGITRTDTQVTLRDQYEPNSEYVCIITMRRNELRIQLLHNNQWQDDLAPVFLEPQRESFTTLTLQSGDGVIDVVKKNILDYHWSEIELSHNVQYLDRKEQVADGSYSWRSRSVIWAVVLIPIVAVICISIVLVWCFKERIPYLRYQLVKEKQIEAEDRNADWVISSGIFTYDEYDLLRNSFEKSRIDIRLIECLRHLDVDNYHHLYTDMERYKCRLLLDTIVENEDAVLHYIRGSNTLGEVARWRINCFMLALAFLAKINDRKSTIEPLPKLLHSLDILRESPTKTTTQSMIESLLFSVCNLLRVPNLQLPVINCESWLPYTRLDSNGAIKLSSSYIIVFLNNRSKVSGIPSEDMVRILRYMTLIFQESMDKGQEHYNGFVWGTLEREEMVKISNNLPSPDLSFRGTNSSKHDIRLNLM